MVPSLRIELPVTVVDTGVRQRVLVAEQHGDLHQRPQAELGTEPGPRRRDLREIRDERGAVLGGDRGRRPPEGLRGPVPDPVDGLRVPATHGPTAWDVLPGDGPEWTADGVLRDSRGPLGERRAPEAGERAWLRIVAPFQL